MLPGPRSRSAFSTLPPPDASRPSTTSSSSSSPSPRSRPARRPREDAPRPRNVVFMIADGFGPASESLARARTRPLALDALLTGLGLDGGVGQPGDGLGGGRDGLRVRHHDVQRRHRRRAPRHAVPDGPRSRPRRRLGDGPRRHEPHHARDAGELRRPRPAARRRGRDRRPDASRPAWTCCSAAEAASSRPRLRAAAAPTAATCAASCSPAASSSRRAGRDARPARRPAVALLAADHMDYEIDRTTSRRSPRWRQGARPARRDARGAERTASF